MFLFIEDKVLGASNDTSCLDTLDALSYCNAREDWIRAEACVILSAPCGNEDCMYQTYLPSCALLRGSFQVDPRLVQA